MLKGNLTMITKTPPQYPNVLKKLASKSYRMRLAGIKQLCRFFPSQATDALVHALLDPEVSVRLLAIQKLSRKKNTGIEEYLFATMQNDSEDKVRIEAAKALSRLKDKRGLPLLLSLLQQAGSRDYTLAYFLAKTRDPLVGETILDWLNNPMQRPTCSMFITLNYIKSKHLNTRQVIATLLNIFERLGKARAEADSANMEDDAIYHLREDSSARSELRSTMLHFHDRSMFNPLWESFQNQRCQAYEVGHVLAKIDLDALTANTLEELWNSHISNEQLNTIVGMISYCDHTNNALVYGLVDRLANEQLPDHIHLHLIQKLIEIIKKNTSLKSERLLPLLLSYLPVSIKNYYLFESICKLLGLMNDQRAVEPLLNILPMALKFPLQDWQSLEIINTLGLLGDKRANEALQQIAESSPYLYCRKDALEAIQIIEQAE